ncbi:acyl-CoA dehydrogenase family protein [Mycolicibacterium baixiangningiae]|uniref:acyl-CoA dehydrogenase family protein n=1 Tax=Mycolicibacterium baixiangningiae TaxID=2761578 RepID=UPI00186843CF|nr:acyl-CoA dehydrogenase family protein [Mycolicibacterium baixiangningiae]
MQFELSEEQLELQRSIRAFVERYASPLDVLSQIESDAGFSKELWNAAAAKLGLQSLNVPEDFGGMGASNLELMAAIEELGAGAVPGPLAPCIGLAVPILDAAKTSPLAAQLLGSIADGTEIVAVAPDIFDGHQGRPSVEATEDDQGKVRLNGTAHRILTPQHATTLLVLAGIGESVAVVAAPADALGVRLKMHAMLDPTRREGDVEFSDVRARVVVRGDDATAVSRTARRYALLFAAAEAVGGAQRALDLSVQYAKERKAFGKVIGTFQALKHRMADMYTELEISRSLLWYAAWLSTQESASVDDVESTLLEAKLVATESYLQSTRSAISIFGGIGYTWEHPIHLYFKRATSLRYFGQSNDSIRDEIASRTFASRRRNSEAARQNAHS